MRRTGHILFVVSLPALLLTATAPPALGACGGVKHVTPGRDATPGRAPLAIGDSVLLGALRPVSRAGFEIDTKGCRSVAEGLGVMRKRRRAGTLPPFTVLALGSNGGLSVGSVRAAMRIAGPRRMVGVMTSTYRSRDSVMARRAARRFRGRVILLDWAGYARGRSGWLSGDRLHLSAAGAEAFGRLFRRSIADLFVVGVRSPGPWVAAQR